MNNPKIEPQRRTAIKKILLATTSLSMADALALNSIQGDGTALGKDDQATRKGLNVIYFVRKMIQAIDQKKWEVSIGGKEKLGVFLKRLSNKLLHNIVIRSRVR